MCIFSLTDCQIARTSEHSRTGKTIPKGVISQFEAAEAKKDEEIEKVKLTEEQEPSTIMAFHFSVSYYNYSYDVFQRDTVVPNRSVMQVGGPRGEISAVCFTYY